MKKLSEQFAKFGIVGVTNVLVTYGIYYLLVFFRLNYLIANTIGYVAGILNSYYWNNKYVFKNNINSNAKKLMKVFISYFVTYILNIVLLSILVQKIGLSETVAPVIVIVVTIPVNFVLNKFWAFREKEIYEDHISRNTNL